jgi:hypothetical protein
MANHTQDESRHGFVYVPGQTQTTGFASGNCSGPYCSATYSGTTTETPGTVMGIVKHGVDIYVRFYHQGEIAAQTPGLWSVASVIAAANK